MKKIKLSDEQQKTLSQALERIVVFIDEECYSVCDGRDEDEEQTLMAARKYVLDHLDWWLKGWIMI